MSETHQETARRVLRKPWPEVWTENILVDRIASALEAAGEDGQREGAAKERERVRPEVRWFASEMERKLAANDDRKSGWKNTTATWLAQRLLEEADELMIALAEAPTFDRVTDEAADVANFAMMIADNVRARAGAGGRDAE